MTINTGGIVSSTSLYSSENIKTLWKMCPAGTEWGQFIQGFEAVYSPSLEFLGYRKALK